MTGNFASYNTTTGIVTVLRSGFYWIYSQIVYYNRAHSNSFKIWKIRPNPSGGSKEKIASCVESQGYNVFSEQGKIYESEKFNTKNGEKKISLTIRNHYMTCNTAISEHLSKGESLVLASPYTEKYPSPEEYNTFWGLARISGF